MSGVRQISKCFIKPKQQLKEHSTPVHLTTWDLAMLSMCHTHGGLLYPCPQPAQVLVVDALLDQLKTALSIALVHFYPLAGQLQTTQPSDDDGLSSVIFIDPSKGPGAGFIHAAIDLNISDLLLFTDDIPFIVQSFFSYRNMVNHDGHHLPLLTIQVTQLLDGICIGCSMNHVCGDAISYLHFFSSLSEIFMNNNNNNNNNGDQVEVMNISKVPIHTRWQPDGFSRLIITLPFSHPDEFIQRRRYDQLEEASSLREKIFHFSSESIHKIKSRANYESSSTTTDHTKISSLQAVSALVWRCITKARRVPADETTTFHFPVNNRRRLDPPLPDSYFGNCFQVMKVTTKAGELHHPRGLGWTALRLSQVVNAHNDKTVRDTVAARIQTPFADFGPRDHTSGAYNDVYIAGSPLFTIFDHEFGLGKPVAMLGYGGRDGVAVFFQGRHGHGSIDLQIYLLSHNMRNLETDQEFLCGVSKL